MLRRHFLSALPAAAGSLAAPGLAWAQGNDTERVVPASKIIDALRDKAIVLDRPGTPPQGAARPAPRPDPSIDLRVQFTFGSSELLPQGKRQLDQLAMALADRNLLSAQFLLAGHTDVVGSLDANMRLSMDRADAVRDYLIAAHGLPAARLQTVGYGPTRLAVPSNPQSALNRRVEVRRLRAPAPGTQVAGRLVPTPAR
ncbi:MAG: OmpA family protein [Hydrogenophaga sp.]|jgi:outer membrane protein OmpA-like peptidoglycan-associated protein|nr:OmpA family protein [Hydrogenophaga sp.]